MEQSNVWILAVAALGVGVLIGYLIARAKGDAKALADERDQARNELESYKEQVTSHFEATAELVNGLTDQYRRVHQHLADGAQHLCTDPHAVNALQESLQPRLSKQDIPTVTDALDNDDTEELPQPPRDYAPKEQHEEGTLSARYGLKETAEPKAKTAAQAAPAEAGKKATVSDVKTDSKPDVKVDGEPKTGTKTAAKTGTRQPASTESD